MGRIFYGTGGDGDTPLRGGWKWGRISLPVQFPTLKTNGHIKLPSFDKILTLYDIRTTAHLVSVGKLQIEIV